MIGETALEHPATKSPGAIAVLAITTVTLVITTWGALLYTTVATVIAGEFGVPAAAIGYQVGLAYLSAMLCTLYSGNVTAALGARGALVASMILAAAGSLATTAFTIYGLILGTVLLGLAHGLVNPPAAVLLSHAGKEGRRSFLFSIRQTGTPLGGLAVALITPWLAESFGWRAAGYALAFVAVVIGLCTWLIARGWDATSSTERRRFSLNPLKGLATVARSGKLRVLAFVAMCYAGVQVCLVTFLSPFLVKDIGLSLILAGWLVAMAQASGGFGRPFWGLIADLSASNLAIQRIIGIVAACSALVLATISEANSIWLLCVLVAIFGATAVGWNGVFAAEVVRVSPRSETPQAMAGSLFFTFASAVILPAVFALIYETVNSYSATIALLGVVSLIGSMATFGLRDSQT